MSYKTNLELNSSHTNAYVFSIGAKKAQESQKCMAECIDTLINQSEVGQI